ncbi:hypothetical protein QE438_001632 [Pseudoxanthomonas sp. SORGH_AS 997]|nr:hypothetical protein [Pseudoxanthomonas sp. SORGH_AS_0997]
MIAATAPSGAPPVPTGVRPLEPISRASTAEANRMVEMVMPETGLLDDPISPAR